MSRNPSSPTRLILVRHGRSAHVHDGSWIDRTGAEHFEALYDAASIRDDDAPPPSLVELARSAEHVVASDLPRAVASARRLASGRDPVTSDLLRELRFDLPAWGPRLPLDVWDGLHYLLWTYRLAARISTAETRRSALAADWLESELTAAAVWIAVTHGGFRRLLAAELVRRGWSHETRRRPYHHWSAWSLIRRSAPVAQP